MCHPPQGDRSGDQAEMKFIVNLSLAQLNLTLPGVMTLGLTRRAHPTLRSTAVGSSGEETFLSLESEALEERSSVLFCLNLSFDIEKLLKAPFDWAQKKENQSLSRCLLIRYSSPSREFWVSAQVLKRQDRKYRPWTKFFIATPHTAAATPTHYSMITPSLEVLKEKVGVM
eukprot:RCo029720